MNDKTNTAAALPFEPERPLEPAQPLESAQVAKSDMPAEPVNRFVKTGLGNNLSEGSVLRKMIMFALPFLASNIIQSLYNVADMLIVGNFSGSAAMSGVNIGGQVTFILTIVVIGLCVGATVLIGQYVGAKNNKALADVTSTIITVLLMLGFIITIGVLFAIDPILNLIRTPAESFAESRSYLTVTVTGIIFIFGYNALAAILRGMGDSKHPLWFVAAACVTNILLDLLFVAVFKWSAFGAALATVISQAMSVVLCIAFMKKNNFQFDFKLKSFRIDREQLRLIFKIGLPTSVANTVTSLSFLFVTAIVNIVGGVVGSAAVGAVGKFSSFAFMPTQAIAASVSTMAAQNMGANRLDRAVHATILGTVFSMVVTYLFFFAMRIKPEWAITLFSREPEVIEAGVMYLNAFSYDFLLIPIIFNVISLFIGGGHTVFAMVNNLLSSVLLRVPACYLFAVHFGMGMRGVGLGAPVASAGTLLVIGIFLLTGRWKTNVLKDTGALYESI
ncbi:MAG: MATE family efflux transporter [Oscillospiraceae bacterium]|nr:MATE family efflux transporter [Oscillospiraceae bacterium]